MNSAITPSKPSIMMSREAVPPDNNGVDITQTKKRDKTRVLSPICKVDSRLYNVPCAN